MKDNNQNIDNLFRQSFQDYTPPPPKSLWDRIESDLEGEDLDKVMKSKFKNYEVTPNPEVWNRIERRLPFNLYFRKGLRALTAVAALLLFGMLGSYMLEAVYSPNNITPSADNSGKQNNNASTTEIGTANSNHGTANQIENVNTADTKANTNVIDNNQLAMVDVDKYKSNTNQKPSTRTTSKFTEIKSAPNYTNNTTVSSANQMVKPSNVTEGGVSQVGTKTKADKEKPQIVLANNILASSPTKALKPIYNASLVEEMTPDGRTYEEVLGENILKQPNVSLSFNGNSDLPIRLVEACNKLNQSTVIEELPKEGGVWLNIYVQGQNSWVVGKELQAALATEVGANNIDYSLNFGQAYGAAVAYQVSNNWMVSAGWEHSAHGQKYVYTNNTSTQEGSVDVKLKYNYIPVTFKYKAKQFNNTLPGALNFVFGAQFGAMSKNYTVTSAVGTESAEIFEDRRDAFVQREIGATAGVDYDFLFKGKDNMFLTLGVRASLGSELSSIEKPNNATFGVRAAFNYNVRKKR